MVTSKHNSARSKNLQKQIINFCSILLLCLCLILTLSNISWNLSCDTNSWELKKTTSISLKPTALQLYTLHTSIFHYLTPHVSWWYKMYMYATVLHVTQVISKRKIQGFPFRLPRQGRLKYIKDIWTWYDKNGIIFYTKWQTILIKKQFINIGLF